MFRKLLFRQQATDYVFVKELDSSAGVKSLPVPDAAAMTSPSGFKTIASLW